MILEAAVVCLALNLYHEARSEPIEGQFAVAQVVLNRADRDQAKVCGVVQAYRQFSWTLRPPSVKDMEAYRHAQGVARLALQMPDFTGGATHYHNLSVSTYWVTNMTVLRQYGNHIFYTTRRPK